MSASAIEWTEQTWNPVVGCTKVSPGCKNCYAEVMARRLRAIGVSGYEDEFTVVKALPRRLADPLRRSKPTMYFVNSMSDLFHPEVSDDFIHRTLDTMQEASHHIFQVLTKRPERVNAVLSGRELSTNIWLGTSIENRKHGLPRLAPLKSIDAAVRFLSIEPLLEDIGSVQLDGISWVIVGGESGHRARPMDVAWVRSIRDQCASQDVAFFFKQWGTWGADGSKGSKKRNGRILDGRQWNSMPVATI